MNAKLIAYCTDKHNMQTRKDGSDYFNHPVSVANRIKCAGYGDDYIEAALCHDLLEDTDATEEEILELTNEAVLEAVKLLTKAKGVSTIDYINNILDNKIAKVVKNYDRIDNLCDLKTCDDTEFIQRYIKNTKEYFVGKFSKELDEICEIASKTEIHFYIDSSMTEDISPKVKVISTPEAHEAFVFKGGMWETEKFPETIIGYDNIIEVPYSFIKYYIIHQKGTNI